MSNQYRFCKCCGLEKSIDCYGKKTSRKYDNSLLVRRDNTCIECKRKPQNVLTANIIYTFLDGKLTENQIAKKFKTTRPIVSKIVSLYLDNTQPVIITIHGE